MTTTSGTDIDITTYQASDPNIGLYGTGFIPPIKQGASTKAGCLRLALADLGDIFFATDVPTLHHGHHLMQEKGIQKIDFGQGEKWLDGNAPETMLDIVVHGESTTLDGYYEDAFGASTGVDQSYEVLLYLEYEPYETNDQ